MTKLKNWQKLVAMVVPGAVFWYGLSLLDKINEEIERACGNFININCPFSVNGQTIMLIPYVVFAAGGAAGFLVFIFRAQNSN